MSAIGETYAMWASRLSQTKPVAYILGRTKFYGYTIFVDPRTLIPRPETEILVAMALKKIEQNFYSENVSIADIGTGSGCIAIALAHHCPRAGIIASDISDDALLVARKNIEFHGLSQNIRLMHSDLLANISDQKFDLIVANLPYIGVEEHSWVSESVRKYEPHTALFGGEDGFDRYRTLVQQIVMLKYRPKFFIGEIGDTQYAMAKEFLESYGEVEFFKDYQGLYRAFSLSLFHA